MPIVKRVVKSSKKGKSVHANSRKKSRPTVIIDESVRTLFRTEESKVRSGESLCIRTSSMLEVLTEPFVAEAPQLAQNNDTIPPRARTYTKSTDKPRKSAEPSHQLKSKDRPIVTNPITSPATCSRDIHEPSTSTGLRFKPKVDRRMAPEPYPKRTEKRTESRLFRLPAICNITNSQLQIVPSKLTMEERGSLIKSICKPNSYIDIISKPSTSKQRQSNPKPEKQHVLIVQSIHSPMICPPEADSKPILIEAIDLPKVLAHGIYSQMFWMDILASVSTGTISVTDAQSSQMSISRKNPSATNDSLVVLYSREEVREEIKKLLKHRCKSYTEVESTQNDSDDSTDDSDTIIVPPPKGPGQCHYIFVHKDPSS